MLKILALVLFLGSGLTAFARSPAQYGLVMERFEQAQSITTYAQITGTKEGRCFTDGDVVIPAMLDSRMIQFDENQNAGPLFPPHVISKQVLNVFFAGIGGLATQAQINDFWQINGRGSLNTVEIVPGSDLQVSMQEVTAQVKYSQKMIFMTVTTNEKRLENSFYACYFW